MPDTLLGSVHTSIAASTGVTVTASATPHAKGAWVELVSAANNIYGCSLLSLAFGDTSTTGVDTSLAIDIGIGAAASEVMVIEGIMAGYAGPLIGGANIVGGRQHLFPLYVPPGVRVAARCQALIVSDTVIVIAHLLGGSPWGNPSLAPSKWETYGFVPTTTKGVAPVCGTANVKGSWLQVVASTTREHRYFFVSVHGVDTSSVGASYFLDLGVGAAASEIVILPDINYASSLLEIVSGPIPDYYPLYRPVPSGSRLAVRMQSTTASDANLSVSVHAY